MFRTEQTFEKVLILLVIIQFIPLELFIAHKLKSKKNCFLRIVNLLQVVASAETPAIVYAHGDQAKKTAALTQGLTA